MIIWLNIFLKDRRKPQKAMGTPFYPFYSTFIIALSSSLGMLLLRLVLLSLPKLSQQQVSRILIFLVLQIMLILVMPNSRYFLVKHFKNHCFFYIISGKRRMSKMEHHYTGSRVVTLERGLGALSLTDSSLPPHCQVTPPLPDWEASLPPSWHRKEESSTGQPNKGLPASTASFWPN